MKKTLFLLIFLISASSYAGLDVGTNKQKIDFTRKHLTKVLEMRGYKLKKDSLVLKESVFNIVSSFSEIFVPGGKDEQYVKFTALYGDKESMQGYVRIYTDSFIPRFSDKLRGEAVERLIDPSTNDPFYIWMAGEFYNEINLHLKY